MFPRHHIGRWVNGLAGLPVMERCPTETKKYKKGDIFYEIVNPKGFLNSLRLKPINSPVWSDPLSVSSSCRISQFSFLTGFFSFLK